ncbi:MAG: hypothetical protein JWR67_2239 [Mucilaginibacter sp.]|nr:hypothetical protein [Mucilaginibacter sp.]
MNIFFAIFLKFIVQIQSILFFLYKKQHNLYKISIVFFLISKINRLI